VRIIAVYSIGVHQLTGLAEWKALQFEARPDCVGVAVNDEFIVGKASGVNGLYVGIITGPGSVK